MAQGMAPGAGSQVGAPSFMSKGGSKAVTDHDDSSSQVGPLKAALAHQFVSYCRNQGHILQLENLQVGALIQAERCMQESEEELNERLRQLKGLDKERDKNKKMSKQEQEEENLFKKNKGEIPSSKCRCPPH